MVFCFTIISAVAILSISSAEAAPIATTKVVQINGKLVDMTEFKVTEKHTPFCDCVHLHPKSGGSVTARDGTVINDPAPGNCGYGCLAGIKKGFVRDLPMNIDADRDGLTDTFEMELMTDPNNPCSDGQQLDGNTDGDKDGLTVYEELAIGTDPRDDDSDDDGIPDGVDFYLPSTSKDMVKIPMLINIWSTSTTSAEMAKSLVEKANTILGKAGVMLVPLGPIVLPDNDGDPNGDGSIAVNERAAVSNAGKQEIDKLANKKGMKVHFVKEIKSARAGNGNAGGLSDHPSPVIEVSDGNAADMEAGAGTVAHESLHAFGVEHNTLTPDDPTDDGVDNVMDPGGGLWDFLNMGDNDLDDVKVSDTQKAKVASEGLAKSWGYSGTMQSPFQLDEFQYGRVTDLLGDAIGGAQAYQDIDSVQLTSENGQDEIDVIIALGGLVPESGIVETFYSVLLDTDNDPNTGISFGSFTGIDYEIQTFLNRNTSDGELLITGTVIDWSQFLGISATIPDPELVVQRSHGASYFPTGEVDVSIDVAHQLRFNIQKSEVGPLLTEQPVGVNSYDFSFNIFDETPSFIFDGDLWLDVPTLNIAQEFAAPGDSVPFTLVGLTPNTPFDLLVGSTVVLSDTTDGNGDFSSSFTFPTVTEGQYFVTAIDTNEVFAFSGLQVTPDLDNDGIPDASDPTNIINSDTTLTISHTVIGEVIVQGNSALTIPSGLSLDLPPGSNLLVVSGSTVFIDSGGSLHIG